MANNKNTPETSPHNPDEAMQYRFYNDLSLITAAETDSRLRTSLDSYQRAEKLAASRPDNDDMQYVAALAERSITDYVHAQGYPGSKVELISPEDQP